MNKKKHVSSAGVIPPHYFKDKNLDIVRDIYRCSTEMNRSMDEYAENEWNFCPNCGADMRGNEE